MYLFYSVSEYLYKAGMIIISFIYFRKCSCTQMHFDQGCVRREEREQEVGKRWLNVLNLLPPLHIAQQIQAVFRWKNAIYACIITSPTPQLAPLTADS